MRRLFLMLFVAMIATAAQAQTPFDGVWDFTPDGAVSPAMVIELNTATSPVSGAGIVTGGIAGLSEGTLQVSTGVTLDGVLQVELTLAPSGQRAVLTVIEAPTATLAIAGQTLNGLLTASAQVPTTAPAEFEGDVCTRMLARQQDMFLNADTNMRGVLRRIYDEADRQYGQDQTDARCTYLLGQLAGLVGGAAPTRTAPVPYGNACDDVDPLLTTVYVELEQLGRTDDGSVETLLSDAGLGTGGVWSTGACEYGIALLRDFLADLPVAPAPIPTAPTATDTGLPIKDPNGPTPIVPQSGLRDILFHVQGVSEHLNMRSGPGTEYGLVYQLPYFARDMRIIGQGCTPRLDEARFGTLSDAGQAAELDRRWCEVRWNGTNGWVSGQYIRPM